MGCTLSSYEYYKIACEQHSKEYDETHKKYGLSDKSNKKSEEP